MTEKENTSESLPWVHVSWDKTMGLHCSLQRTA